MSDEEIGELIRRLRALLLEHRFGWALEQAEAALNVGVRPVQVAKALIDAAEAATIGLADIELQAANKLGVEEIRFELDIDDGEDEGPETLDGDSRIAGLDRSDPFGGPRRRGLINDLVASRLAFETLRRQLDDNSE